MKPAEAWKFQLRLRRMERLTWRNIHAQHSIP